MGEGPDQIKQEVETARSKLEQDLNELQYRVTTTLSWRAQFERRPWTYIGAIFGFSALVGWMTGR